MDDKFVYPFFVTLNDTAHRKIGHVDMEPVISIVFLIFLLLDELCIPQVQNIFLLQPIKIIYIFPEVSLQMM